MRRSDIVARAAQAQTLSDLRRAVVDWMLADIQREAERAQKHVNAQGTHAERTRAALAASLNRPRR